MKKTLIFLSVSFVIFVFIRYLVNDVSFKRVEIDAKVSKGDTTRLPWADITAPNWEISSDKRRLVHGYIDSLYKDVLGSSGNYHAPHRDNVFFKDRPTTKEWVDSLFNIRWYDQEGYQHRNFQVDYDGDTWGANYDMCLGLDVLIRNPQYISTYITYYTVEQNYGKRKTNTTSNVNMKRMKADVVLHIVLKGELSGISSMLYGKRLSSFERDIYMPLGEVIYGIEQPQANTAVEMAN